MTRKLLAVLFTFLCGAVAFAQNATTSVRGVVSDPTGALVSTATVTLTDNKSQDVRTVPVGSSGEYSFQQVTPSNYTLSATAPGFGTTKKQVELLVSQPATINFVLPIGGAEQTVEVTSTATLNFTDATLGNAISNQEIQATPINSRNVADLLSLQPGVLYFNANDAAPNPNAVQDSRAGAVAGARSDQGNITLDGIDDNDQTFGFAFTGVLRSTLDSTEEYRVTTASAMRMPGAPQEPRSPLSPRPGPTISTAARMSTGAIASSMRTTGSTSARSSSPTSPISPAN